MFQPITEQMFGQDIHETNNKIKLWIVLNPPDEFLYPLHTDNYSTIY